MNIKRYDGIKENHVRAPHDPEAYQSRRMAAEALENSAIAAGMAVVRAKAPAWEFDWDALDPLFARFLRAQWDADLNGMAMAMDEMGCPEHPRTKL